MCTVNRLESGGVFASNTVFSAMKYSIVCQVDKEWIYQQCSMQEGKISHIANKYVISVGNRLYSRQDDVIWLVELK